MAQIESRSKLTSKNQTTIPMPVRKALRLGPEDQILFTIHDGGRVEVSKAEDDFHDPVITAFLDFVEADLISNPQKLTPLQRDAGIQLILAGVETESFDLTQ